VQHDLRHSIVTLALVTTTGVATTFLVLGGVLRVATERPTGFAFAGEVLAYVLLFDAYFYTLHRLLHTRVLYRSIHAVHHRSTAPTVLTAFAFHPLEALAIIGFMPVAMSLVPIHLVSLAVVSAFLSGSIVLAHCGHEVLPDWWQRVPVLNWYVTSRIHHAHHRHRDCNYSATLSIFDRAFGTLRTDDVPNSKRSAPETRPAVTVPRRS
jgi:sterol desaturase/sphingolipid hydroxylase (fatty acid hydroxylase superfamily)